MQEAAGLGDVGVHLGDQRVDVGVALLAAEAVAEVDRRLDIVEVAREVEQERLDVQLVAAEGGVGAGR